ncbi:MAG: hypothetical protein E7562_04505 [Ruminococcaceae bacterium]|nr:hypothetical protein [Oscillospiraceae bacterium]
MKKTLFAKLLASLLVAALVCTMFTGLCFVSAAEATDPLVITDCDTTDGWVVTGGNPVSINENGYGTNTALHRQVNYGATRQLTYNLPTPLDVSNYTNIEWDMQFYTQTTKGMEGTMWEQIVANYTSTDANTNYLYLKLISSNGGYRIYRIGKLNPVVSGTNNTWVHFTAKLDDCNSDVNNFDPTALSGFYFSTTDGSVNTNIDDGFIRFDNIKATGYEEPAKTPIVLTECEDTTGWSYAGTAALGNSASGKTGAALILEGGYGILRKLTYTAAAPVDATGYTALEWDMTALAVKVITDQFGAVIESYTDTIGVEVSDGTTTATYSLYDLEITKVDGSWWHVAVDLSESGLDLSKITTFVIYTKADGAGNTELANTIYKFDNLYFTNSNVQPNGYNYAALGEMVLEDAEGLTGWTYYGEAVHANMSHNVNGYVGGAVNIFGGYCKIGPAKYTFDAPVNISRHSRLAWNVRFLNGTAAPDMWDVVAAAYADYIKATITDSKGASHAYTLSDITVEATAKEGWYTLSVDLKDANIDFTSIASFTFQTTDGAYMDTTLSNGNMRIDNICALPEAPLAEGDVNGDKAVNAKDLVRIKRYLADEDVTVSEKADLDLNGVIEANDAVCLRKLMLGMEYETAEYQVLATADWSETVKP